MNDKERIIKNQKISLLIQEEAQLQKEIHLLTKRINEINAEIKRFLVTEPVCSSCGRHRLKEDMIIVSQDIINDHRDSGEGYGSLSLGEYYCGC
jgi:Na+/phosphate symporter